MLDGLVHRNETAFNQALLAYLDSFQDLNVDALAFVQLARQRGLALKIDHRMLPSELIEPRQRFPQDGYPTWP